MIAPSFVAGGKKKLYQRACAHTHTNMVNQYSEVDLFQLEERSDV